MQTSKKTQKEVEEEEDGWMDGWMDESDLSGGIKGDVEVVFS